MVECVDAKMRYSRLDKMMFAHEIFIIDIADDMIIY